jgi:hypothetical protein
MAIHGEDFNSYTNYLGSGFQQENRHLFALCDIFDVPMGVMASACIVLELIDVSDVDALRIHYDFTLNPFSNWLIFNSDDVDGRVFDDSSLAKLEANECLTQIMIDDCIHLDNYDLDSKIIVLEFPVCRPKWHFLRWKWSIRLMSILFGRKLKEIWNVIVKLKRIGLLSR